MLRKRVITVLTFNDGVLFRTKKFTPDYRYTLNFIDSWSVDEIVALDITRPGKGQKSNFFKVIERMASFCFVPLAAGGGIRNIGDVREFLALGADKVTINTQALARPEFITEIAEQYGTQCVVVSMDALRNDHGDYEVLSEFATKPTGWAPVDWARKCEQMGAGEILVTSVEKDGSIEGYDLELCKMVAECVRIPVLICGGAGTWSHFEKAFVETAVSAVCTANIYHFTEASIKSAKTHLNMAAINVRV